jgi:hypothetical protein
MSVMQQEKEQEIVHGSVQQIITKGPDKWQVGVLPLGSNYPKNLWTKDQALVNDLTQRIGQGYDFICNVSHWNMQDGTPVRSLWIESLALLNSTPDPQPMVQPQQAQQQAQSMQPQQHLPQGTPMGQQQQSTTQVPQGSLVPQKLPEEVKELRIMRQTASKVASILLPYLPESERNLDGFVQVAEWLVGYYAGGAPQRMQAQDATPPQGNGYSDPYAGDPGPQEGQYQTQGFPQ